MAILREGIVTGNNLVEEVRKTSSELSTIGSDIISYLNGNRNFQTFREGTEKGAAIYNNLNICVNTIVDKLVPTIEKMAASTTSLLNEQQNLNRADSNRMV